MATGTWTTGLQTPAIATAPFGGRSMQFNILPPDNYDTSGKTKYAVLLAMHPDFDGMNGSSYKTGSNFVNGTAYVGGTQSLNSLFNNNAFRADFPAIVIAPQCYQPGSDTVDNFGGYGDEDDSGGNEQGLLAIFAALLAGQIPGIAAASINPDLIVGWGYSLGAIGILAMLLDNPLNNPPAGGKPLLAAAVGMSDQISRAGVTNSSFFVRLEATPYFAISTSSDNNPASVDEPLWQSITGNQKWPTEAQYNSGGVASCRAGISDFYYINVGSGDPTNPFAMLKANGGNGDAIFQWLFGVVGGGVTTIPSNGATPMTASPSGTIITPTSGGSIIDSAGNEYTMDTGGSAPGQILLSGSVIPGSGGTTECIICSGTCYAENAPSGPWYSLVGLAFTQIPGDPPCLTVTGLAAEIDSTNASLTTLQAKVETMSGNLTQAEADIAALTTANTKMESDLAAIKTVIQGLQAGTTLTQADVDALHAAAGLATTNTAAADALVPPPATPPAA